MKPYANRLKKIDSLLNKEAFRRSEQFGKKLDRCSFEDAAKGYTYIYSRLVNENILPNTLSNINVSTIEKFGDYTHQVIKFAKTLPPDLFIKFSCRHLSLWDEFFKNIK
jgi:hypothetical protein